MYKQETIFYKDTFQIHITKDYIDNNIIEEKHYTQNNLLYYWKDYMENIFIKRFFFQSDELDKKYKDYHYLLTYTDTHEINVRLYTEYLSHAERILSDTIISKRYMLTENTCTHLCTLDNDDAIHYIQNYIKIQILEE
jgi:hypothetical protein